MSLLIVYVVLVGIGEVFAALLGLYLDNVSPTWSLPIALTLVFGVIALAWPVSVYATDRWLPENRPAP